MKLLTPSVWKNSLALLGLQAGNYLAPLVVLPLLAQRLSPSQYGDYAFILAVTAYAILLVDWGFSLSATRLISLSREDASEVARIFWATLFSKLILGSVAFCMAALVLLCIRSLDYLLTPMLLSILLSAIGTAVTPLFLFQGLEQMGRMALINAAIKLLTIPATWWLVQDPGDLLNAVLIQASAILLAGFLNFAEALRVVPHTKIMFRLKDIQASLRDGYAVFVSTAAISLYTNTNLVFLKYISTAQVVGYFFSAQTIIKAVCGLYGPVAQAIFPRVSFAFSSDKGEAARMLGRYIRWQFLVASLLCVGVFLSAPFVIRLMFGDAYLHSVAVLQSMCLLPLVLALSNTLGVQTLIPLGDTRAFSRILIVGGVVSLAFMPLLAIQLEAVGVALSVVLTETLILTLMAWQLHKHHQDVFDAVLKSFRGQQLV